MRSQLLDLDPHHPYRGRRGRRYHLWKSEQVLIESSRLGLPDFLAIAYGRSSICLLI